jgi:thiol:disulfide interchange protein
MKLRYSLCGLLLLVTIAGVGIRLSMWAYEEYYIPRRKIPWITYSPGIVERLREDGNLVIVHFTADWDPTVQVVQWRILETPEVRKKLYRCRVSPVLADLTDGYQGPAYAYLRELRAVTIPLTVVFPANASADPIVLHDIYSKEKLMQTIDQANWPTVNSAAILTKVTP